MASARINESPLQRQDVSDDILFLLGSESFLEGRHDLTTFVDDFKNGVVRGARAARQFPILDAFEARSILGLGAVGVVATDALRFEDVLARSYIRLIALGSAVHDQDCAYAEPQEERSRRFHENYSNSFSAEALPNNLVTSALVSTTTLKKATLISSEV
jgi:hypothetical protein